MSKCQASIDSCSFFHLVEFNTYFENGKTAELEQLIKQRENEFSSTSKLFEDYMDKVLPIFFKNYSKSDIFNKKIMTMQPLIRTNAQNNKNIPKAPDDVKSTLISLNEKYAQAKKYADMGELFKRFVKGDISFTLTPVVQDEIKNHIAENNKNKKDDENENKFITFPKAEIDGLMSKCNLLKLNEKEQLRANRLSLILRGLETCQTDLESAQSTDGKTINAMKNNLNKQKIPADSLLMAQTILANIPLITQNEGDFIIDKGFMFDKNIKNKLIFLRREKIKIILKKLGLNEECLPYTPTEFLKKFDNGTNEKEKKTKKQDLTTNETEIDPIQKS